MTEEPQATEDGLSRRLGLIGCGAIAGFLVLLLGLKIASEEAQRSDPTFTSELTGTTVGVGDAAAWEEIRMAANWARDGVSCSSGRYLEQITSWPDVYPDHVNSSYAWSPNRPDGGLEWVEVRWSMRIDAKAVVVVETFNPGAVTAIDDLVDADRNKLGSGEIVRVWSGTTPTAGESRILVFEMQEPRPIIGLRIVLDTTRVSGYNAIDAVGLLDAEDLAGLKLQAP